MIVETMESDEETEIRLFSSGPAPSTPAVVSTPPDTSSNPVAASTNPVAVSSPSAVVSASYEILIVQLVFSC